MSWDGTHATCAGEKKVAAPHQKRDPGGLKEKAATEKTTADGKPTIIYIYECQQITGIFHLFIMFICLKVQT